MAEPHPSSRGYLHANLPPQSSHTLTKEIAQFEGLYGETTPRPIGEYLFSELLETRSRTFNWLVKPHIHHRLFQIFFLDTGQVLFEGAVKTQTLTAPCVLLIPPTALHGFRYSPDVTGRILTLSASLIDELFPPGSPLTSLLGAVHCLTEFAPPYTPATVLDLIRQIDEELVADLPQKRPMLLACLQRLMLVLYRLIKQDQAIRPDDNNLMLSHFRRFQALLQQAGLPRNVTRLARELSITPVHLNRICRGVAQKSASQLVQEQVIGEACKYLTHTSYSVSEIAYLLHFEYPNYFARFFRKQTGLSPSDYRQQRTGVITNPAAHRSFALSTSETGLYPPGRLAPLLPAQPPIRLRP